MKGEGQALCHGAVSVLNAFATGKGGALGVDLWTRARVSLYDGPGEVAGINTRDPSEPKLLMIRTVEVTLAHYGIETGQVSGEVVTSSNIPTGVGLKSSSSAANAIVLATISALGQEPDGDDVLEIATKASIDAKVSLTGAYDDAYACYHGGGVITDNARRKVEKRFQCPEGTRILILVPSDRKRYTGELSKSVFDPIHGIIDIAYREAVENNHWHAMTLNGLAYSAILGEDPSPAVAALKSGALAAGLSGKGPAVAAIVDGEALASVRDALARYNGKTIEVSPNMIEAVVEL